MNLVIAISTGLTWPVTVHVLLLYNTEFITTSTLINFNFIIIKAYMKLDTRRWEKSYPKLEIVESGISQTDSALTVDCCISDHE
jgi:hypothetical protein